MTQLSAGDLWMSYFDGTTSAIAVSRGVEVRFIRFRRQETDPD
jgi:hypothetical protein